MAKSCYRTGTLEAVHPTNVRWRIPFVALLVSCALVAPAEASTDTASGTLTATSRTIGVRNLTFRYRIVRASKSLRVYVSGSVTALKSATIDVFANAGSALRDDPNGPIFGFSPSSTTRRLRLTPGDHRVRFTLRARNLQYMPPTAARPSGGLVEEWTDCVALGLSTPDGDVFGSFDLPILSQTDPATGAHT